MGAEVFQTLRRACMTPATTNVGDGRLRRTKVG